MINQVILEDLLENIRGITHFCYLYHVPPEGLDFEYHDLICRLEESGFKIILSVGADYISKIQEHLFRCKASRIHIIIPQGMSIVSVQNVMFYYHINAPDKNEDVFVKWLLPADLLQTHLEINEWFAYIKKPGYNNILSEYTSSRAKNQPIVRKGIMRIRKSDYDYFSDVSVGRPLLELIERYGQFRIEVAN